MKLKEYLDHLNNLVKENPKILDFDVVYSSDDEGNYYGMVHYAPSVGEYDFEEPFNSESDSPNAICIN